MSWLPTRRVIEETRIASNALLQFPSLCRVGQRSIRPVLKHGPRSLTCMQAIELTKLKGAVKAKSSLSARGRIRKAHSREFQSTSLRWDYTEHKCWDPKDGELCLPRLKVCICKFTNASKDTIIFNFKFWTKLKLSRIILATNMGEDVSHTSMYPVNGSITTSNPDKNKYTNEKGRKVIRCQISSRLGK